MAEGFLNRLYTCQSLHYAYREKDRATPVLNGLDMSIEAGDFLCLTGPSGSGKSTLLNLLGLIEHPQDGDFFFKGQDVGALSEKQINEIRRYEIGFIFQDFQLIDVLSVEENVEYFLTRQKIAPLDRKERVEQALEEVGLLSYRHKRPGELSGGQKQRTAIARALAKHPAVIIADEPTASLDLENGRQILELLGKLNERHTVTVVLASHDPMVLDYCHREIRLQDGRIVTERKKRHAL
jgi:ABC-type lipoprotein export system ATPase subunit